jgi:hypothetical protein
MIRSVAKTHGRQIIHTSVLPPPIQYSEEFVEQSSGENDRATTLVAFSDNKVTTPVVILNPPPIELRNPDQLHSIGDCHM